ncbi:MAG: response regulator [Sphaerobacteraceae bacterium]|nr:MAG: response regulator [Sphaerobacteraceae bacterium]
MDKPLIAVINDDPGFLEMMEYLLKEERDCEVVVGQQGDDALRVIKSSSPDLIVLDIILGSEPLGVQILQSIRADSDIRETPVIICSADSAFLSANAEIIQSLNSETLGKPFDVADMLALIDRHLS